MLLEIMFLWNFSFGPSRGNSNIPLVFFPLLLPFKYVNQSSTVLLFSYKTHTKGTFNLKNGDKNEGIALVRRKGPTEAILPQGFHKEVWSSLLCHRDFCGILICHHDTIISILLTFVSNFFFLSGNNITLAYGSEVPLKSFAGTSCASTTPTAREFSLKL